MVGPLAPRLGEMSVEPDAVPHGDTPRPRVRLLGRRVDALDADGRGDEGVALVLRDERLGVLHGISALRRERLVERRPGEVPADARLANGPSDFVLPVEEGMEARRPRPDHLDPPAE